MSHWKPYWWPRTMVPWRVLLAGAIGVVLSAPAWAQPQTSRVSVGSGGIQANHPSGGPAISADGRWVAFHSSANNLVPGDTNDTLDVFLHDRHTGITTRISVGPGGVQGDAVSHSPDISADGRFVAFESAATTLVAGDTNHAMDVFVYDRHAGQLRRVSVGPGGVQGNSQSSAPAISADGRWVAFGSLATNLVADDLNEESDVFVHDLETGATTRVSVGDGDVEGNGGSGFPAISADGRWVAFTSLASNLVPHDTNDVIDTFVRDRTLETTTRVSVNSAGDEANGHSLFAPAISGDGRWVAFQSAASNLAPGDTNGTHDVFLYDRDSGTTAAVSVGPGGAFGDSWSEFPGLSTDGRTIAFNSNASNLVTGDNNGASDVFVYDIGTAMLARVSVNPAGTEGDAVSTSHAISGDGRWVAFESWATNLVDNDTNGYGDIFVHDRLATVPLPPSGLVVESVVGDLVTLRWTVPAFGPQPTHFLVEGGTAPGQVLASFSTGTSAPMVTFTAPAGSFYVRVVAVSGTSRSAASNEVQLHVNVPVVPSAPANLLGLVSGSTVTLVWTPSYSGGAPTSYVLDVAGAITTSFDVGRRDTLTLSGVPPGTYVVSLRAVNGAGSSTASNTVTLTVPGPCSGPPQPPTELRGHRTGATVHVAWSPGASGPAPTAYVVVVTGALTSSFVTTDRSLSGTVGPGTFVVTVLAANSCGVSPGSAPHVIVVP